MPPLQTAPGVTSLPGKRRRSKRKLHKTLRPPTEDGLREIVTVCAIYILVMGLTGAGKSTFISVLTGDDSIPIGADGKMDGETQEVQDYVFNYRQGNIIWEIHLIDSPGFDDGTLVDTDVLSRIAAYINTTYKLKQTLAHVLYMHDITRAKMGEAGIRNIRVLEGMIGKGKWDNCTIVTTKWGMTQNPAGEEAREKTLMAEDKFFGEMMRSAQRASMARFDPKSHGRALEIIKPYLQRKFDPLLSEQMVDPGGPRLALGETDAGRVVASDLAKLRHFKDLAHEVEKAHAQLGQKFDERLFEDFKAKRDALILKQRLQKAGRWATRTVIVGGAITATVLTMGPGASAFALEPAFEKFARRQKREERSAMERLKKEFKDESALGVSLKDSDPAWLQDQKVQRLSDLEGERYSIKARSSGEAERPKKTNESEENEDEDDMEDLGALGDLELGGKPLV